MLRAVWLLLLRIVTNLADPAFVGHSHVVIDASQRGLLYVCASFGVIFESSTNCHHANVVLLINFQEYYCKTVQSGVGHMLINS